MSSKISDLDLYKFYQERSSYYIGLLWKNFLAYGGLLAGLSTVDLARINVWFGGSVLLVFLAWFQIVNLILLRATVAKSIKLNDSDIQIHLLADRYFWSLLAMLVIPPCLTWNLVQKWPIGIAESPLRYIIAMFLLYVAIVISTVVTCNQKEN